VTLLGKIGSGAWMSIGQTIFDISIFQMAAFRRLGFLTFRKLTVDRD